MVTLKSDIHGGVEILPFEKSAEPPEKTSQQQPETVDSFEDKVDPPYDLELLTDFYVENTWHYRCVNLKADLVCAGMRIQAADEGREPQRSPNYQTLRAWLQAPNAQGENLKTLLKRFWIDLESLGNAYLEIARHRKGAPAQLYHVPAYTIRKAAARPGYWQLRQSRQIYFNPFGSGFEKGVNELKSCHFYYPKSSYYGVPDFLPALFAALLDKKAMAFNHRFFENGLLLSLAIITRGFKYDETSQQKIQQFFRQHGKGLNNAHGALYLPIDDPDPHKTIHFERLMSEVNEAGFRETRRDIRDEIIAAHGVLPRLVGVVAPGSLGGASEGFSQLRTFKMLIDDKKETLSQFINPIIRQALNTQDLEITFGRLDITNRQEDSHFVKTMRELDVLTESEARAEVGYAPKSPDQKREKNLHDVLKALKGLKTILEEQI